VSYFYNRMLCGCYSVNCYACENASGGGKRKTKTTAKRMDPSCPDPGRGRTSRRKRTRSCRGRIYPLDCWSRYWTLP